MFTTMHFVILGICFVGATVILYFLKKKQVKLEKMMTIMVIVTVFSELGKVLARIDVVDGKALLASEFLPFHLCSIQLFLIWYLKFFCKNKKIQETLLAFMYPTCFLGGLMALIIATVDPVSFANPDIYEYFGYHMMMVVLGLYIPLTKQVEFNFKTLVKTGALLLIVFFFSIYLNSMFTHLTPTNFFFSAFPPLDGLPYLNFTFFGYVFADEKIGWIFYILKLMFLGLVLVTLSYLPFLLKKSVKDSALTA
ncbi:MAG: hypothetical protein WC479_04715 [Candidatus Izemoplasmatales bacterium]|jgi:hypothetical protein|nr:YwaF family protein [Candidatus Izemoplasmatales bacterium]MDD3865763.1 YwaF family protein [Candidatus Izemoplasmatales bacterium]